MFDPRMYCSRKHDSRRDLSETTPISWMACVKVLLLVPFFVLSLTGCSGFRAARLYQQGTLALNAGDAGLAISRLREAGHLRPDGSQIQNHLGLAFATSGQQEKALAAFRRAVELDCSNAAAAYNLTAARAAARDSQALARSEPVGEPSDER